MNLAEQFLVFLSSTSTDDQQYKVGVTKFIPLVRRILRKYEFRIVIMEDKSLILDNEEHLKACSTALELAELLSGHPNLEEILADLNGPTTNNDFPIGER